MDRLRERLNLADRAQRKLAELARLPAPSEIERDAAIKRFESAFESTWKAAQRFLLVVAGDDAGSPKLCIRGCRQAGLLDDRATERALEMADDRNLTVHTYNEPLAVAIYGRLQDHSLLLGQWLAAMRQRLPK